MTLLTDLLLAFVAFVSTNVDDVFVLLACFSDQGARPSQVVIGQYAGMAVLMAISGAAALVSLVIPASYVGLLGLVPIAIGGWRLVACRRSAAGLERRPAVGGGASAVVAATLATGSDNIAVYTSMFATGTPAQIATTVSVCAVMTGAWCWLALGVVRHPAFGAPIRRWGSVALPVFLIGVGLVVVCRADTLRLIGL